MFARRIQPSSFVLLALVSWVGVDKVAASTEDAKSQVVHGVVVDEAGTPVAGTVVTAELGANSTKTTADAEGQFELKLSWARPGSIFASLLAVAADGRLGTLSVQQEKPESVRVVVKPGRELTVHVRDEAGQAVADADVIVLTNYRKLVGGTTDATGRWRGHVLPDMKDWTLVALKGGVGFDYATSARARGAVAEPNRLPAEATLKLDGARKFAIKAVDREGKPVAGVRVGTWLVQKKGYEAQINVSIMSLPSPVTGDDGLAVIDWLPAKVAQSWTITHHAQDLYAPEHALSIPATDAKEEVTINLLPVEEIQGRVTHADGRPAEGIVVTAQGKGSGSNDCRAAARTDADGRYKLRAYTEQAYVIAVGDKNWTAPYRADVVVRAGQEVPSVNFVLTKPTRVHGRVTMGKNEQPAAQVRLGASIDKGQIPAELRKKDDRIYRAISMYFSAMTDADGNYELFLGPGDYRLQGPPRTQTVDVKIPLENPPAEIVRDFSMPRAETGPLTVRVVDSQGRPMAGATLTGTYASSQAHRFIGSVKADANGTFQTERSLDPLILHAITSDNQLAGIVRSESEAATAEVVVGPLASASGRLLNLKGEPIVGKDLSYAIRVFHEDQKRQIWTNSFGGKTTTDKEGRFEFINLVPGQLYDANVSIDEHSSRRVTSVKPESAQKIDLGDIKADTEPHKPYVPPTAAETTAEYFAARPKSSPRERLNNILAEAEREYTRPLILLGSPTDKACVELFRLFDARSDVADKENPTVNELRWEFELLALDVGRSGAGELASELGLVRENATPLLAVLNPDGKVAATYSLNLKGDKLDGPAIARFLKTHKLPTRDAENMLAGGMRRAQTEDKRVFFIFSASWCGPCRMLARFISDHKAELDKHYVFVKLDVSRDSHAQALREKYKESKSGGVPWYTILDAQGNQLVTSNAPAKETGEPFSNSNIGFPSEPPSVDHFVKMLRDTAPRLSPEKLAELRVALQKSRD